MRGDADEEFWMFEGDQQRAVAAHRDAVDQTMARVSYRAILAVNERQEVFDDGVFVARAVFGVEIKTVRAVRHGDDELAHFAGRPQRSEFRFNPLRLPIALIVV